MTIEDRLPLIWKNDAVLALAATLFTMVSIMVFPGYHVFADDHFIYMPSVLRSLDPTLFPNDIILSFNQADYTLFDEAIVWLTRTLQTDLFSVMFVITVLARFIYFFAISRMATYLTGNVVFGSLSSLLFLKGFSIYGTCFPMLDTVLVPRVVAIPLCLLSASYLLYGKLLFAVLPLALAALVHPITIPAFVLFSYFSIFSSWRRGTRRVAVESVLLVLAPIAALALLRLSAARSPLQSEMYIDKIWESVLRYRTPYVFITSWSWWQPCFIAESVLLAIISGIELRETFASPERRRNILVLLGIPVVLSALSFVGVDFLKLHIVAEFQLSRSLLLWKVIITILFAYFAFRRMADVPSPFLHNICLAGIVSSLALEETGVFCFLPAYVLMWAGRRMVPHSNALRMSATLRHVFVLALITACSGCVMCSLLRRNWIGEVDRVAIAMVLAVAIPAVVEHRTDKRVRILLAGTIGTAVIVFSVVAIGRFTIQPRVFKDKALMEVCEWLTLHTSKQDVILAEPFTDDWSTHAVRLIAQRNLFASENDGAQGVFVRAYALEWNRRETLLLKLKAHPELIYEVARQYKIDYVLSSEGKCNLPDKVFDNGRYAISRVARPP